MLALLGVEARLDQPNNGVALRDTSWLHRGESCVRMSPAAAAAAVDEAAAVELRVEHMLALLRGATITFQRVQLSPGTCLVCGQLPIAPAAGHRCVLCARAADIALERHLAERGLR